MSRCSACGRIMPFTRISKRFSSQLATPLQRRRWPYPLGLSLALLPGLFWFLSPSKPHFSPYTYSTQSISSTTTLSPSHKLVSIAIPASSRFLFTEPIKPDGSKATSDEIVVQHVMIGAPQIQIERPYTPINDPATGTVDTVVKRVQGGEVGRLVHSLQPGQDVEIRGPLPTFSLRPSDYDRIVMISTGTGVAPFLQFMSRLSASGPECHLVHLQPSSGDDWITTSNILSSFQTRLGDRLKVVRPAPSALCSPAQLRTQLDLRSDERRIILVCLPPHLMRPLCGGLSRNLEQGPLTGALADLGIAPEEVWKLQ